MWEAQQIEVNSVTGKFQYKDDEEGLEELLEELSEQGIETFDVKKLVQTPFGTFDIDDTFNPMKQFELWLAHTNFNITADIAKDICKTPGVEVFSPVSRYRFIIGVGKLFELRTIRVAIEKNICGLHKFEDKVETIDDEETKSKLKMLKSKIEQYPKWAIFVFPNGNIDYTFLNLDKTNRTFFNEMIEEYKNAEEITTGILLESD